MPRLPHHTPSRCDLLCRGHAPLDAPYIRRLPVPMPARPARPLSPAMCVPCSVLSLCWFGVLFLIRSGQQPAASRLLSVALCPVAMRLLPCVATHRPAVNALSPGCRVVALVVCCAMRSVCKGRIVGSRLQLLCFGRTCDTHHAIYTHLIYTIHHIHTTPHPLITHIHPPRSVYSPHARYTHIPHTPHRLHTHHTLPHTSYTPYTASTPHHVHSSHTFIHHPSPMLAHTQIWDGMLLVTYLGYTSVFDQIQQTYPMLYNALRCLTKFNQSIQPS